jgi:hypothetical protein
MLYDRIIGQGTINEPGGKPEPLFALPSTVNWMRALRILVEDLPINFATAAAIYHDQNRRAMDDLVVNTILEQLFLSLHHLSALHKLRNVSPVSDVARIGILTWYYGISNAASAMTAAQDGSFQEDHAGTARIWDTAIASRGLALGPFGWRVSSLVERTFEPEVAAYRGASTGSLQVQPRTPSQATAAAASYLSGSAKWYAWLESERVRDSREFRALNVSNFRTRAARDLRDNRLRPRAMGFVHQAFRYRGKANYREALFLAYGRTTEAALAGFVDDQAAVLKGFVAMAGVFAAKKLGVQLWGEFVADVAANRAFSIDPCTVWG